MNFDSCRMTKIAAAQKQPTAQNAQSCVQTSQPRNLLADPFRSNSFDRSGGIWRGRMPEIPFPRPMRPVHTGSALLDKYNGNFKQLAKDAKISGKSDVKNFGTAMERLQGASARIADGAAPGGKSQLKLTPDQIARIQAAPTQDARKAEVLKAISAQTGVAIDKLDPLGGGKKGNKAAREALNGLLGTKIKNGREKNNGAAITLDAICDSVARTVTDGQHPFPSPLAAKGGTNNSPDGGNGSFPGSKQDAIAFDLKQYEAVAEKIAELHSPLIFDLAGTGLKLKEGELIEIDVDGDGNREVITDLDRGIGLLVFDSQSGEAGEGRDYFGDKTDLSAYGIVSPRADRFWDNGFDALRALCEHYELVHGDKQHLDARDLEFLEREVGLRMRIDGVFGSDRTFAEVKITRINLGDPQRVQSIRAAQLDAFGNKLMKQEGATFVVDGETREYADIWFNVQARVVERPTPKGVSRGL
jgi:hypothetical protein